MMRTSLTELPDEILRNVCFFVDWKDALALSATSNQLSNIASEHLLWKYYCRTTFKYWAARHQLSTIVNDASFQRWKQLFRERYQAQVNTRHLLGDLVHYQTARISRLEAIVDLGYDSKDELLGNRAEDYRGEDYLARRYWAHVAIGCLHRSLALKEWLAIRNDDQQDQSFDRCVGAFDLFILDDAPEGDLDDISRRLAAYVKRLREAHPSIDDQSPRQKATTAAQFLIANRLLAISEERDYYNLEHNFLGRALFSPLKNSLPIITVIIYCQVARHLGLRAAPCAFPFHVHAIVQPPPGVDLEGDPLPADQIETPFMHMDPFRSHTEIPISSMQEQLNIIASHIPQERRLAFLSASPPIDITLRCARNILNSLGRSTETPSGGSIDDAAAQYAAFWVLFLYAEDMDPLNHDLPPLMHLFTEKFPFDVALVEKYIVPLVGELEPSYAKLCRNVRMWDQNPPPSVKRRLGNPSGQEVRFKIGQVFRHKRYNYTAVVSGWDPKCDAGEEWISRMRVERLERGRRQAFYLSFVLQDKSIRYVAEENIELLPFDDDGKSTTSSGDGEGDVPNNVDPNTTSTPTPTSGAQDFDPNNVPIEIGRWFKRWDAKSHTFVSNLRGEYPDD